MERTVQHKNNPRVVITGGGTGGHIFPAIAIANALSPVTGKESILFIGAEGKMEMERVPAAGYKIHGLPISGLQRKLSSATVALPFRLIRSFLMARRILKDFSPAVVVGVGGFASAPALLAARWLNIPIVIQEQNSIPGKVNRWFGNKAKLICTAFPGMERHFKEANIILTGNPVRKAILNSSSKKAEGCLHYGFDTGRPVLLVLGGSQGARSLNEALIEHLPLWTGQGIQVIWQTGKLFAPKAEEFIEARNMKGVVASAFIEEMDLAYGAATMIVSRAGALAIAEIALAGLPAIFAPFPFAAGDHQSRNAQAMAEHGAAFLIPDSDLIALLGDKVSAMINDTELLLKMQEQTKLFAYPDADETIARLILETATGKKQRPALSLSGMEEIKRVYFLGAGGIGMSGLARWFLLMGKSVHGYDKTMTPLTKELEKEGVKIHYEDRPELIPDDTDLVVITPAIPSGLKERDEIIRRGLPVLKRAEVLGLISREMTTIAVAGTHGKTSTSALIAHLLKDAGIPVTGFIGGITKNYESNFIFTPNSRFLVVEADEFDRSFLHLSPDFSIITSTDADHLDIYGTHENMKVAFAEFGNLNGTEKPLFVGSTVDIDFGKPVIGYGLGDISATYRAVNIRDEGAVAVFDLILGTERSESVTLGIPGRHNIENAVAASAAAIWCGVTPEQLRAGLATYRGVRRRFDIRVNNPELVYIDDYAHHPRELTACIDAVRKIFPGRAVTGIFQPHLFTRTRDFAEGFASSLEVLDRIILLEIYPAREEPIPGINSTMLLELISNKHKSLLTKEEVLKDLGANEPDVLLTLGAGDIDTLVPLIEELFSKREAKA